MYLVVARIVRGKMPADSLLQQYSLYPQFGQLFYYFRLGNLIGFYRELDLRRDMMLKYGFYFILQHRTSLLLYRNLFNLVFKVTNDQKIPLETFWRVLNLVSPEEQLSRLDVESIFVSLIDQGYIRGYISPDLKVVVFRKKDAFPSPYAVSQKLK